MLVAMKRHLDLAGKSLAGAGLTGIVLYVVGTATQRSWPFWPYWIFVGMLVVGGVLYFLGQRPDAPNTADTATADDVQEGQPTSAFADRWRPEITGASTTLTQLQHNSMSHPAYMRRDPQKRPPRSLRIGIVIGSSELDPQTPDTAEVRTRFLSACR